MLGAPELHAVLQVGSHEGTAEEQNLLPCPTGHFTGCSPWHYWLFELWVYVAGSFWAFWLLDLLDVPSCSQSILCSLCICAWGCPNQVQHFLLGFIELHVVCTAPLLNPVRTLLDGIPALLHVTCTTLALLTNLLRVHSIPPKMLPLKIFSQAGSNITCEEWHSLHSTQTLNNGLWDSACSHPANSRLTEQST